MAHYNHTDCGMGLESLEDCSQNFIYQLRKNNTEILNNALSISVKHKDDNTKYINKLIEEIGDYYTRTSQYKKAIKQYKIALIKCKTKYSKEKLAGLYNKIGKCQTRLFNYDTALSNFNKALSIFRKKNNYLAIAYTYNCFAKTYLYNNEMARSWDFIQKALKIYESKKNTKGLIYTHCSLGDYYNLENKNYLAKNHYQKALQLNDTLDHIYLKIYSYNKLSNIYIKLKKYTEALKLQNKAYNLSYSISYSKGMARSTICKANLFIKSFQYTEALEQILKAKEINNRYSDSLSTAKCCFIMGEIFSTMENNIEAKKEYKKALKLFITCNDKENIAMCYMKLAMILGSNNKLDLSDEYYNKALVIFKSFNNRKLTALCLMNKGLLIKNKNKIKAKHLIFVAKRIFKNINNKEGIADCYYSLGLLEMSVANNTTAQVLFENSLKISTKLEFKHLSLKIYLQLYNNCKLNNNYKEALVYHEKYIQLRDRIIKLKTQLKIGWTQEQGNIKRRAEKTKILEQDALSSMLKLKRKTNTSILLSIIVALSCFVILIIHRMNIVTKKNNTKLNHVIKKKNKAKVLLEEYKDKLEETVNRRTLELIKARNRAVQADNLKTKFLANMSHEIRTPLNAIVGFSELLAIEKSHENQCAFIGIISQNSDILLNLVNDIITISLIETNQFKINLEDCSAESIFLETKQDFIKKLHKSRKEIKFISKLNSKDKKIINTDKTRVKQVINSILDNALKYTKTGEILFTYKIKHNRIIFFVSDTGIGINREELNFIFDQFRQASNNEVQHGGTGLGLSISKSIIELLGGGILVKSTRNKGSLFMFHLPLT